MKRWKLYFAYAHLPPHLQAVSKPFHDLAVAINDGRVCEEFNAAGEISDRAPHDKEEAIDAAKLLSDAAYAYSLGSRWLALRHLLRAKDCAVRAHIPDPPDPGAG